ncbi:hypothetical protein GX831_00610 [bacterium]|nr:hypothetical protein [bacterium]
MDEYEELKKRNLALEVGLRIHLPALYIDEKDVVKNDRFGLTKEEYFYILDDLKNSKMILSTIHFHQRGFDYEEEKFRLNFTKAFEEYYVTAAKRYKTVVNYNIGGGTPLPVSGNFDYYSWANEVIKLLKFLAKKNQVKEPNLLSENGKYSQKDATINLYKVVGVKNTDEYPWYIIDGSLMIAMPELFALGEPIRVCPVNNLDREIIKVRLAGLTCDCDDIYFDKEKGYFLAPRESKDLYIACLGTGSYQNSMSGKGGVHHCLLPEERDVVIYRKNGKSVKKIRSELQSISKIYRLMHFKK